ncbi:MAG: XRE family transcriptional regulator [Thermomicrobiales bacterium]|nr:XRE family transcriptional regulator [Thermomicrobiales bacterium]
MSRADRSHPSPENRPGPAGFGGVLRRFRLASGLTQEQLAERSGTSARGIRHLEAGDRIPRLETVRLLGTALDLSAQEYDLLLEAARPELAAPPPAGGSHVLADTRISRIPLSLTSLIGRDEARRTVAQTITRHDVRLLTLTGPPGVGKTRLMIETGHDLERTFALPVCFVSLAPIADPGLVVPAIFQALGGRSMSGIVDVDVLSAWIGDLPMLLLVDNFEHLLPAASAIPHLLSRNPGLKVIVTSRTVLRVSGETVMQVPPLGMNVTSEEASEAEQLFMARAKAIDPAFEAPPEVAAMVRTVCQRLDGLPLAIELAAGQLGHQTIEGITSRTEGMLPLLTAGPRDQSKRLQAMTSSLEWSYALLSTEAQSLFRRLAVFRGGFTADAVQAVGGGDNDALRVLVEANLVVRPTQGSRPRYALLELIREFAGIVLSQAGEGDLVREAHAVYFSEFASRVEREGWLPRDASVTSQAFEELPNIREALQWLDEQGDGERLLRTVGALPICWISAGNRWEGQRWIEYALQKGSSCSPLARSKCHVAAEQVYYYLGDVERALWHAGQAHQTAQDSGDPFQVASTGILAASSASYRGDYQEALRQCELGLRAAATIEDREMGSAVAIWFPGIQGRAEHGLGHLDTADQHLTHAIELLAAFENPQCATRTWCSWGSLAITQGHPELAIERYVRGAQIAIVSGDETLAATNLRLAAAACALLDRFELAAQLAGAVRELERRSGPVLARNAMDARVLDAGFAALHGAMGERDLDRVMKLGEGLSLSEAVELIVETHAT